VPERGAGFGQRHLADGAGPLQRANDEIALGVGVAIGRVRDLEGEPREPDSRVLGSGARPHHALALGRTIGVEPKARRIGTGGEMLEAFAPEAHVVALARAVADRLLETDVLATP